MITWHCDHYRWSNQEVKPLPKHNPQVKKSYFQTDTPNGLSKQFTKHAYQLITPADANNIALIHYIGNESHAIDFPHGNTSQESEKAHVRTCPSVLDSLQESYQHDTAAVVYRNHVTNNPSSTHLAILQP